MEANREFCQSCGMPLVNKEVLGTNADNTKNEDYCKYCFEKGSFTSDCTMEEMIDCCVKIGQDMGMYLDPEQARRQMLAWFPTLKRWKGNAAQG